MNKEVQCPKCKGYITKSIEVGVKEGEETKVTGVEHACKCGFRWTTPVDTLAHAKYKGYNIPMREAELKMWELMEEKEKDKILNNCIGLLKSGTWKTRKEEDGTLTFDAA